MSRSAPSFQQRMRSCSSKTNTAAPNADGVDLRSAMTWILGIASGYALRAFPQSRLRRITDMIEIDQVSRY